MSILQSLINSKIIAFSLKDTEVHIEFDNGATLNIFNQSSITPLHSDLSDSVLTSVTEDQSTVILTFNHRIHLEINLEEEAYNGPEAISHTDPSGFITVWN